MPMTLARQQAATALEMVETEAADPVEKAEMLMEIAMGLQQKPQSPEEIDDAIGLYQRALTMIPESEAVFRARVRARLGTALAQHPDADPSRLEEAQTLFRQALETLEQQGGAEEQAEVWMNLGLALQSLSGLHRARITDAISAYQRALQVFQAGSHPAEFAILHNNLATAFLSIPMTDARARMREALAVQSFEAALEVITLVDHPAEYAMLQNNLGNALQYVSSAHAVENNLRALDAYEEALKVRNPVDTPMEYANTIANQANALSNLPDDPDHPERGNPQNLRRAVALLKEAQAIFARCGEMDKVHQLSGSVSELESELASPPDEEPVH